jgi:hypothetical protein
LSWTALSGAHEDARGGQAPGVVGLVEGVQGAADRFVDGQVLESGAQVGVVAQAYHERERGQGIGIEQSGRVDELDAQGFRDGELQF